jgi:hypothetical protein
MRAYGIRGVPFSQAGLLTQADAVRPTHAQATPPTHPSKHKMARFWLLPLLVALATAALLVSPCAGASKDACNRAQCYVVVFQCV